MPSKKHIVVVQDLASRFSSGKIVTSTKASSVIQALSDIYNNFGNPDQQLSDNGPPFNPSTMDQFYHTSNMSMEKVPSLHPPANLIETFMKSIGKSMKISNHKTSMRKSIGSVTVQLHSTSSYGGLTICFFGFLHKCT